MRRSQLFIKTRKDVPSDEVALNAQLLIRGGFVHKEMAGVYDFLPLGLAVLNKIIEIIRQEMNAIGGQEVYLSGLQPKDNWEKSGRWHDDVVDVWFKTRTHGAKGFHLGPELGLGNTHEEAITAIARGHISSYKDLPTYVYQFQTKYRNEPRAKSGLLRCREFIMKDLYSFSGSQAQHDKFYEEVKVAYGKIFKRLGLSDSTYLTYASGGSFSKFSHEFQTLLPVGEDTVFVDKKKKMAVNKDVITDDVLTDLGLKKADLKEAKAVEVGNIFPLGTRFSKPLGLNFVDRAGQNKSVVMGSYGIGPGRVMGVIAERFADKSGLVWPEAVAPFMVYLVSIGDDSSIRKAAQDIYSQLTAAGVSVLYDDRDERAGEKFADADLLGLPYRVVVSEKLIKNNQVELKARTSQTPKEVKHDQLVETLVGTLVKTL